MLISDARLSNWIVLLNSEWEDWRFLVVDEMRNMFVERDVWADLEEVP